jgi:TolB protein
MNADGAGQTRLTHSPVRDLQDTWSPDGMRIVFIFYRDSNEEIYVMNADGAGQTRLTHGPGRDLQDTWSPDGMRIAFTSDRDGSARIGLVHTDGNGQMNLTRGSAAVWSRKECIGRVKCKEREPR